MLHDDEIPTDEALVRALLTEQCPQWSARPLTPAGAGTENTMYRLGPDLLVRLPRTVGKAAAIAKEQRWLPRLAPLLTLPVPEPVHAGTPTAAFPARWSVHRWIDGVAPGPDTVTDWAAFGTDLAGAVRELHGIDLMGATRTGELSWYRGGRQHDCVGWVGESFAGSRTLAGDVLDVGTLERLWQDALTLPEPAGPHVWLHGDLRPGNLLVHAGRLHALIDFGALSVGFPDAEHATVWDLPAAAREAYRDTLRLDDVTWQRARAWAVAVGISGVAYYWHTYPGFVAECLARLRAILADTRPASPPGSRS